MNELSYYNDIDFNNLFDRYHPNDNSLRCENNTLYYNGDTKFFAGRCGITKGEGFNLGYFRVGNIDTPVWKLEPANLYFLVREYINAIHSPINIKESLSKLDSMVNQPVLGPEKNMIVSFMDYYNSLKMFKEYLRDELKENYDQITDWINDLTKKGSYTPGYTIIYNKLFEQAKSDAQLDESSGNANGYARQKRNGSYKPKPVPISTYYEPSDNDYSIFSKDAAFVNILVIIFLIIATIAIVLTLIFL